MKYLIFVVCTFFMLESCTKTNSINLKNDLQKAELKGKIKSISAKHFSARDSFGIVVKTGYFNELNSYSIRYYNQHGYITKVLGLNKHGNPLGTTLYYYNASNHLVKIEEVDPNSASVSIERIEYDSVSNTEIGIITKNEKVEGKKLTKYNLNKQVLEYRYYDSLGNISTTITHTYDINGNNISSDYVFNNNTRQNQKMYYDSYGKLIKLKITSQSPTVNHSSETIYTYNDMLDVIYSEEISKDNVFKTTYTYLYDELGNWIKKTCKSDNLIYIYEREIEYYP